MGKPEAHVEDYLVAQVKSGGGEIRKVSWVGRRGAPDRYVMMPGLNSINFWAELKRLGGKLADHQVREIERMEKFGEIVHVFDSREQIDVVLAKYGVKPGRGG